MPRRAREQSATGIYHVMLRGADRRIIFSDDEDNTHFLAAMREAKAKSEFKLYAYCLMGNHVHLLLQERVEPLETIIKRILCSYVYYYNWKYELHGHLLQDRFRSEPINDDEYFMDVLRYICQNPIKAGLCDTIFGYEWLGCAGISTENSLLDSIVGLTELTADSLLSFVSEKCSGAHLEVSASKRLTDREASDLLCSLCGCAGVQTIGGLDISSRDTAIISGLNAGISIRQMSRLTAVSKAVIERVAKG